MLRMDNVKTVYPPQTQFATVWGGGGGGGGGGGIKKQLSFI